MWNMYHETPTRIFILIWLEMLCAYSREDTVLKEDLALHPYVSLLSSSEYRLYQSQDMDKLMTSDGCSCPSGRKSVKWFCSKNNYFPYSECLKYLYKTIIIVFVILSTINRTKFHLSSIIIGKSKLIWLCSVHIHSQCAVSVNWKNSQISKLE